MRGYHFWIPIKQGGNRWVVKHYANGENRFGGEAFGSEDIANAVVDMLKGWLWSLNIKSISKISTI